ncbi:Peroxisome membrane protein, Pex16 [Corchorus capsularis]|uniref:Peroxisomal membrane protein PEX16 n=1 Tax=Corchorus capsularis TaxID=210143 RepID=A0A1R3I7X7_COCAP|nr:Peroxisome membrane protein, Pex16 [Corchorus capsularis]
MEAYKTWVRRNRDYVHSLESLANGLTWLLPERFSTSEIGPEAVTALLGIITAINEHIIDTAPNERHAGPADPSPFPYGLCISALKDLETLVEVVAEQVIVRLALFRNGGYKMLLHGGETPNIEKDSDDTSSQQQIGGFPKPGGHHGSGWLQNHHGQNSWNPQGRAMSALSRFGESARMISNPLWMQRIEHQHAIMAPPTQTIKRPTLSEFLSEKGFNGALFVLGEVLFITRPLIYVLFIRRYGLRSWKPWFISLAVDFIGVGFISHVMQSGKGGREQRFNLSASEKDEVKRRKLLWALYLMREPFFEKYTRRKLESTEKILEPVPLIGTLAGKIVELVVGAQSRYTYMSGS